MKRFVFLAVAGLCSFASLQVRAQEGAFASQREGSLAPTAPVVPAPTLQNGSVLTPAGSGTWGGSAPKLFSTQRWSPLRSPVSASATEPSVPPSGYNYPVPPLPAGVGGADGLCGAAKCKPGHGRGCERNRSSWECFKAWLCYAPSKSDLPMCQPSPYVTPLQGMFPCTASNGYGCGTGCGGHCGAQPAQQPMPPRTMPTPMEQPLPAPMPTSPSAPQKLPAIPLTSAAPVVMPPRGIQGAAIAPTMLGRTAPAPASPGIAGYRFAQPEANVWKPAAQQGTIVPTSGTQR